MKIFNAKQIQEWGRDKIEDIDKKEKTSLRRNWTQQMLLKALRDDEPPLIYEHIEDLEDLES